MAVVVDVVYAEAVVAAAAGAVAELQLGMAHIGAAAYLAAAGVGLGALLILDAVDFALEVNGGLSPAAAAGADVGEKLISAEKEIVQHRHKGEKIQGEAASQNAHDENHGVHDGQPLHLDGDDEEKQHLHIGEEGGEGEEHAEVDILGVYGIAYSGDEEDEEAVYGCENHTGEEVEIEFGCAPAVFQRLAYEVVEVEEYEGKEAVGVGDENEGEYAPDLTAENVVGGEGKHTLKAAGGVHHGEKPDDDVADDHVQHEIVYAEAGVLIAKEVHFSAEPFQNISAPNRLLWDGRPAAFIRLHQ